jgi:hypothetical protein
VHGSSASGNFGIEGMVFTGISFAYFGGKRKEESLTQRRRGRREEVNQKMEIGKSKMGRGREERVATRS